MFGGLGVPDHARTGVVCCTLARMPKPTYNRQPAAEPASDDIRKYDTEIKSHIKSSLKQYVSAADLHGLIHEVQRLSQSHKHLTDEKYDIKNRIAILNRKIGQLEQVRAKFYVYKLS